MGLGPPTYRVYVQQRGGEPIAELPWTSLSWARELDDCSSASVQIPITSPKHRLAWAVAGLEAWEHELSIHRALSDGADPTEVWVGPIVEPGWSDDQGVRIAARDVTQWWERRTLPYSRIWKDTELATIFAQVADDAMALDPSPGVIVTPTPTGIRGDRSVAAFAHKLASDVLRELGRDGIDYTTIGRNVLCGGLEVPAGRLLTLADGVLRKPQLGGQGLSTATRVHMLAGVGAAVPIDAIVGGISQTRGLVERVFQEGSIEDHASAQQAAWTRWDALHGMPLSLKGDFDPRRGPTIAALIPGALAQAELAVGVRYVDQTVRLARVQVSATSGEQGISETVGAEFVPVGTTVVQQ